MAFNLQAYGRVAGLIDGNPLDFGSLEVPVSISVTGNVHKRSDTISASSNATLYSDELGNFSFLAAAADLNARLVVTDTQSNVWNVPLRGTGTANNLGVPFMLGNDKTVNTSVSINSIVAFNDSTTNSARVSIVIVE